VTIRYTYDVNYPAFRDSDYAETYAELVENIANSIPFDLASTHYAENIHRVISLELERISAAMHKVKQNAFVARADENGMQLWEMFSNFPVDHADTLEDRRKYIQGKFTGRHIYLGYHFHNALENLGGPVRKYVYNPDEAFAAVYFREALSASKLRKITFFCLNAGPAHIRWSLDSPGAGMGWVVTQMSEYSAPWLRSDAAYDPEDQEAANFTTRPWTDLTPSERDAYCKSAYEDWDSLEDYQKWEFYGQGEAADTYDPTKPPAWMEFDWLNAADGTFDDDDAPPRFQEFI